MRKSTIYLILTALNGVLLLFLLFVHPRLNLQERNKALGARKKLVRELRLTDLCLFTEARYTRHLSQADLHSAFQDHPVALEHFPSGSLVLPPVQLRRAMGEVSAGHHSRNQIRNPKTNSKARNSYDPND